MLKTEAIVLGSVKYGDNSIILRTYTREKGLKSFIAGGLHSKKGPLRPALVQPLSLLEIVFYDQSKGELKRLKEASVAHPYRSVYFNPVKSSLAMFLGEMLSHVLKEEEANEPMFQFLFDALVDLDQRQEGLGNFHLVLLYRLCAYLGFAPEPPPPDAEFFDLLNGVYVAYEPPHFHFLRQHETGLWQQLHHFSRGDQDQLKLNGVDRSKLLDALVDYYRLHLTDFGELRSLPILKELQT